MRLTAVFALLLAGLPVSASCQALAFSQFRPAGPPVSCLRQLNLTFHAVSAMARYGLIFDRGAADDPAVLASWTTDGKVHRTRLRPEGGRIIPLGAGFPVGEHVVGLFLADCGSGQPVPRLIRLDRSSPDHGHRSACLRLDPGAGRSILCLSAGRMPPISEGERTWQ